MAGDRIVSLQVLRFFAAAAVIVMHIVGPWRWTIMGHEPGFHWTMLGAAGVDVFFVLSGFVIATTGPLAEHRPTGAAFFFRRFTRVAPLFWLLSLPFIAAAAWVGHLNWPQTAATLFWPVASGVARPPYLEPGWTLCFEMAFYTAVSLLLVGRRLKRNLILGAVILVALLAVRLTTGLSAARYLTSPTFLEFGLGVALAMLRRHLVRLAPLIGVALLLIGLSIYGFEAANRLGPYVTWPVSVEGAAAMQRFVLLGLPASLIVAGGLISDRAWRGPLMRFLAYLGDASYSIYLAGNIVSDFLLIAWIRTLGVHRPILMTAVIALLAIATGVACYRWIERPILRDVRRFAPKPRAAPSVLPAVAVD